MTSTGEQIRLARLFANSDKAVIVAIDHGLYFGPIAGLTDLASVIQNLSQADGILLSAGMVSHCADFFSRPGTPSMIVRLNWASNYVTPLCYKHAYSVRLLSVTEALCLAADMVLASLTIKTPDEAEAAHNVEVFSQYVQEKTMGGVPLICEVFPIGGDEAAPETSENEISLGCRLAAELGADLIKTFYTGKGFERIAEATPIPIFTLGSVRKPRERDVLFEAAEAIAHGARGVVFGRNVVQAREPERMLEALKDVVKAGIAPDVTAIKYHLK